VIDDQNKVRSIFDKRIGDIINGEDIDDKFKGYKFKITGGNDKDGFTMMSGVNKKGRVRLLLEKGHKCYRPRRKGEIKRKSVRGCIIGPDLSVVTLCIIKHGEGKIAELEEKKRKIRLGPKRANKIRKLFDIGVSGKVKKQKKEKADKKERVKEDKTEKVDKKVKKEKKVEVNLKKLVVRREFMSKANPEKKRSKAPKIQRLITKERLRRKRTFIKEKKQKRLENKKARENYRKTIELIRKKIEEKKKKETKKENPKP